MNVNIKRRYTPIERLLNPLNRLFQNQSTSAIITFLAVVVAMIWANSDWSESYSHLWHTPLGFTIGSFTISESLHTWINDGLMAIFFFIVGLEIKRELFGGELSSPRKAILPISAAFGGMVIPALVYVFFNQDTPAENGWGIPMATDIAFSLGILSLLGKRVPISLKIFLTALAIVDDLGAVLIIAFFYTSDIFVTDLMWGFVFLMVLMLGNLVGIRNQLFYMVISIAGLWLAFFFSGVHPTIAGVLAAFAIPGRVKINEKVFLDNIATLTTMFRKANPNDNKFVTNEQMEILETINEVSTDAATPLQKVEHSLSGFVSFIVLPLFALANTGISIHGEGLSVLLHPVSLGIGLGLIIGKFIGIVGMSKLMVALGLAELPNKSTWHHIYGVAFLAGVGFTMSLFISDLAFTDDRIIHLSKISILVSSALAGVIGYLILRYKAK
ncbi:MAG: Na+/H+ antiporter NhaA [Flavobacteriales bacterium]|nr:Na+/H+ antiporter NhaA [Flavobacteriales bacterium]